MDFYETFRVGASWRRGNLRKIATHEREYGWEENDEYMEKQLAANTRKLFDLQYRLYAENRQSLLIVLQALDAGGKDGTINHVMATMNPQGCRVQAFKVPTPLEAAHDFLWREHCVAPRHGEVVIFNRSHYEDVLAGRVHGETDGKILKEHFQAINDFERLLHGNRTTIVKFFLHISKEEQLKRFGERLNDPAKHWKISESDYRERDFWDDYMEAFNDIFRHCSPETAPWFIIPADNKKFRNLAVSEILVQTLEHMNPVIPPATVDLEKIRELYHRNLHRHHRKTPRRLPSTPAPALRRRNRKKRKINTRRNRRNTPINSFRTKPPSAAGSSPAAGILR